MNRIGILTYSHTTNYGAILQEYALFKTIKDLGFDVKIINYDCFKIRHNECPLHARDIISFRHFLRYFFTNRYLEKRKRKFIEFERQYINYSDYCNKDTVEEVAKSYSKIIVGSDQVWNIEINGNDYTYFLDFPYQGVKCSYAASFGYERIPSEQNIEYIRTLLSDFSFLYVREKSGLSIVNQLVGMDANRVIDPTFLLSNEWNNYIADRIIKDNYCVVYLIDRSKEAYSTIYKYAKQNHLKIICLHNYLKPEIRMINIRDASPTDFLNYIFYSDMIFTGSFHAICFSLMFHKSFTVIPGAHNRNSRIADLMNEFNITNNIEKINVFDRRKLDWNEIDLIRKQLITESFDLLKDMLYEKNNEYCN